MSGFYPRKQTVIIFSVCLVAVAITYHFVSSQDQNSDQLTEAVISTQPPANTEIDLASTTAVSGNWQKDFKSVSAVHTPSEQISSSPQTDRLGQDLFNKYLELKQAGLTNDQDALDQAASDIVTRDLKIEPQKTYAAKDLTIADDSSMSQFSKAVARVMESYSAHESESAIMNDYLSANDPTVLKRLDPVVAAYKTMLSSLLAIPTPSSVADQEVSLVNAVAALEFGAESLRASETDSMRGMAGVTAHANGEVNMITALTNLHDTLEGFGVSFNFDQTILNVMLG